MDRFKRLAPVSSLSDEQIQELAEHSAIFKVEEGTHLFDGHQNGQAIYLLSGSVEARLTDGSSKVIQANDVSAIYPLTSEKNHFRSVVTQTPAVVTRIDKALLDTLLTWAQITAPETDVLMSEEGIIVINKADWLKTMFKSPTFRNLPAPNIEELLYRLEPLRVHSGDVIIRQGEPGDYFYMIDKGDAMVTRNLEDDDGSIEMAELSQGATFGEAALISDAPRNATVTMMGDGILLRLSKDDFNKLLKQPTLEKLTYDDALDKVNKGQGRWIDVRLESEFQYAHLAGAVNILMSDMHRSGRDLDKQFTYICYCDTGTRSSAAAFVLKQYGLQAVVLQDGLQRVSSDYLVSD